MSEVFRKHYSYGEAIPILDTHVGMTTDLYEVTDRPGPAGGPYIKAVFNATAGPMKSSPLIVEPLQDNDSKVVHLTNIPVPIAWVRTVDMSLIFDLVNYRWTPSHEQPQDNGLVTFDLRLRAAFSLMGRSYTLQLDQRPCSITLTKQIPQQQPMAQPGIGYEGAFQVGQPLGQNAERRDRVTVGYASAQEQVTSPPAGSDSSNPITNQLDVEERLRQLSTKLLARR